MPPTWTVLAYFSLQHHIETIPLITVGVLGAVCGRIGLYYLAQKFGRKLFSKPSRKNLDALGTLLNTNKKSVILIFLGYAFIPLPSNQLFITAGLAKVTLRLLAVCFAIGRIISYSTMVFLSGMFFTRIYESLGVQSSTHVTLLLEIGGFILIYLVSRIDWNSFIHSSKKKH